MEKSIGLSIESVLDLEIFQNSKLLAGADGLDRVVLSVNVMEVPDILDWVAPGQLLITTAYSIKNDISALLDLIPSLLKKGVAGLGIKPKRYIEVVPQEVIDLANDLSFPVFEISSETSFPDIISTVLTHIVNKQTKVLQDIHELSNSLTLAMLHGGNMQQISEILYYRFGNSVAVISDYFSSYAISTTEDKKKIISALIEEEKKGEIRKFEGNAKMHTYRISGDIIGDREYERIVIPICSDNIVYGNIYMWEDKRTLTNLEQSVVESATGLIALEIVKKSSMLQMENSHKSGFINGLLSEDRQKYNQAMQNAKYFDFDENKSHVVIVIHIQEIRDGVVISTDTLYRLNNIMIGILQQIARSTPFKIMFVNQDNTIILLCESPSLDIEERKEEILNLVGKLVGQFAQGGLSDLVTVGVGRDYESSRELYKSLAEAKRAASTPILRKRNTVFYEEMGIYRILSYESLRQELSIFCVEMLKPLIDYDNDKDLELIPTLSYYFQCQGNMTNLSKILGVHYNTVVYRLQKISELTGKDLDNEDDLLNLQVALKIYQSREYK